jgi:hypothetical protein
MEQHVSTTVSTGPLCHTASRHPTVMGTTKSRKNSLRRFIAVQFSRQDSRREQFYNLAGSSTVILYAKLPYDCQ